MANQYGLTDVSPATSRSLWGLIRERAAGQGSPFGKGSSEPPHGLRKFFARHICDSCPGWLALLATWTNKGLLSLGDNRPLLDSGGDEGTRTPDPLNAIEVLSQLSYIPAPSNIAEASYHRNGNSNHWHVRLPGTTTANPELRQESRVSDSIASLDVSGLLGPVEGRKRGHRSARMVPFGFAQGKLSSPRAGIRVT